MLTALENVSIPLTFKGVPKAKRDKGQEMLEAVGLATHEKHKPTDEWRPAARSRYRQSLCCDAEGCICR